MSGSGKKMQNKNKTKGKQQNTKDSSVTKNEQSWIASFAKSLFLLFKHSIRAYWIWYMVSGFSVVVLWTFWDVSTKLGLLYLSFNSALNILEDDDVMNALDIGGKSFMVFFGLFVGFWSFGLTIKSDVTHDAVANSLERAESLLGEATNLRHTLFKMVFAAFMIVMSVNLIMARDAITNYRYSVESDFTIIYDKSIDAGGQLKIPVGNDAGTKVVEVEGREHSKFGSSYTIRKQLGMECGNGYNFEDVTSKCYGGDCENMAFVLSHSNIILAKCGNSEQSCQFSGVLYLDGECYGLQENGDLSVAIIVEIGEIITARRRLQACEQHRSMTMHKNNFHSFKKLQMLYFGVLFVTVWSLMFAAPFFSVFGSVGALFSLT